MTDGLSVIDLLLKVSSHWLYTSRICMFWRLQRKRNWIFNLFYVRFDIPHVSLIQRLTEISLVTISCPKINIYLILIF